MSERIESSFEKKLNYSTHGIGFILSCIGLFFLVNKSLTLQKDFSLISSMIYGFSLSGMYLSSTLYHYFIDSKFSNFLQKIDHISIYLLIAGSYTPPLLLKLNYSLGSEIFIIIWSLAVVGIIHKIFFFQYYSKASLLIYLFMGWLIIIDFNSVLKVFSTDGIALMVSGGIFYTLGTVFYARDRMKYNHVIWHVFVMAGSACHYFMILGIV